MAVPRRSVVPAVHIEAISEAESSLFQMARWEIAPL